MPLQQLMLVLLPGCLIPYKTQHTITLLTVYIMKKCLWLVTVGLYLQDFLLGVNPTPIKINGMSPIYYNNIRVRLIEIKVLRVNSEFSHKGSCVLKSPRWLSKFQHTTFSCGECLNIYIHAHMHTDFQVPHN